MEKENITINIGEKALIDVFLIRNNGTEETLEIIKKGVEAPLNYFNAVKEIKFDIELIYSREEMDNKLRFKTQNWLIASSFGNKFIVFSPSEIENHTSHKKEEFIQIISHETSHILFREINNDFCAWMHEGIALNIAKQTKARNVENKNIDYFIENCLFKNSEYETFISNQGYDISYKLIKFLIDNYSKETLLELFKVKYDFVESAEKEVCKILNKNKEELIKEIRETLNINL